SPPVLRPEGAADSSPGHQPWVPITHNNRSPNGATQRRRVSPRWGFTMIHDTPTRPCSLGYCLPPLRGKYASHSPSRAAFSAPSRVPPMRKLLPLGLFAPASGLTAFAQPPVAPEPRPAAKPGEAVAPDEGPNAPGKKDGKDGPAESPRMTKLKQLNFDRRP